MSELIADLENRLDAVEGDYEDARNELVAMEKERDAALAKVEELVDLIDTLNRDAVAIGRR